MMRFGKAGVQLLPKNAANFLDLNLQLFNTFSATQIA